MWIKIEDKLPEEGVDVLVIERGKYNVARFHKGISKEDREKMKNGEVENPDNETWHPAFGTSTIKRSAVYSSYDEHANNEKSYGWNIAGYSVFGQDVTHWMELPNKPEIKTYMHGSKLD